MLSDQEKLNRIAIYESLNLSQEEIEWRLKKDEHLEDDPFWEYIRDQRFRRIDEIPDEEWDSTFLEDEVYEEEKLLNESVGNICPGDIVLVKSFLNTDQGKYINNRNHHFVVIGDSGENKIQNKTFFGFAMSSQLEQSNKFNSKEPGHIFIKDYDTILQNSKSPKFKSVYINLDNLSEISYSDIEYKIGHITPEFHQFIIDTRGKIFNKEDTSKIFWEK